MDVYEHFTDVAEELSVDQEKDICVLDQRMADGKGGSG